VSDILRSPYPWMGGKSRIAPLVWERFGDCPNYVEPFFGSGAVLLSRPHAPRVETINDLDCYVANFWRALQADPEAVCHWTDWPVNEADLHARHAWLLAREDFRARMHAEADYYDAKVAGWWVWGLCQWIVSGWCAEDCYSDHGMGVHRPFQTRPHLGAGMGVHRPFQTRPHLGAGMGVHRPSQTRPHLGNGMGADLLAYFLALADRLRGVRVCCGDWSRVLGHSPTTKLGTTAVLLDPPYLTDEGNRRAGIYACDDGQVAHAVREWCAEHGSDPGLRIALCGYQGEHDSLEALGWSVVAWKAAGGYGSRGDARGRANAWRERVWFSPGCLRAEQPHSQGTLTLEQP
jgi:DNA adenine methylase